MVAANSQDYPQPCFYSVNTVLAYTVTMECLEEQFVFWCTERWNEQRNIEELGVKSSNPKVLWQYWLAFGSDAQMDLRNIAIKLKSLVNKRLHVNPNDEVCTKWYDYLTNIINYIDMDHISKIVTSNVYLPIVYFGEGAKIVNISRYVSVPDFEEKKPWVTPRIQWTVEGAQKHTHFFCTRTLDANDDLNLTACQHPIPAAVF